MTIATRVTGPESTAPEVEPTSQLRDNGGTLINPIGPGTLDGPRIAAREARYGNSQEEIEAVMAIDQAAFDRVRPLEQYMIGRAENFIDDVMGTMHPVSHERRLGLIDKTEDIVTNLNDLVTELERGAPASDLADRFVALQNQALHLALPKLVRAMGEAESHLPKMIDPYTEVQRLIAKMPYSSFRPLAASPRR
ncbi:hypothetical protein ACTJKK_02390 [Microbacterium sp. 22179]|uniref:hypothetical protein n=1 Tax=Microbacterium sp. 22179 TaxID=3453886 RepID=UPI003F83703C